MLSKILNLYKPIGLSPLDTIKLFKEKNPEYKDTKMTYAGRLDPMAEGVLIILAGEKVFEKDKYLNLDKEYDAEIVFGFSTDTHDLLGIPRKGKEVSFSTKQAKTELKKLVGDFSFTLPSYSSYKVKGKPMFEWARAKKLGEIEKVKRTTQIYNIKFLGVKKTNDQKLLKNILQKMSLVRGDFRQEKIKTKWQKVLENSNRECVTVKIKVSCSSGTYIRTLAHELGKKIKTGAILFSLKRTTIGAFLIKDSIKN